MERIKIDPVVAAEQAPEAEPVVVTKEVVREKPPVVAVPTKRNDPRFFSCGCHLFNQVLSGPTNKGGWARGRVVNVVGDRSSGKTLLAIEAVANFLREGGDISNVRYVETEAALDEEFARTLGLPEDLDPIRDVRTVEDLFDDLNDFVKPRTARQDSSGLYIIDSLDAVSDESEQERDIRKGTYGAAKPKILSEMFRRINNDVEASGTTMFVISQVRDKLNVTFGETKTRSGGRALDFYASQIVWLAEIGKIKRTVSGQDRAIGVEVRARTKKNKMAPPFRECNFTLIFGYGVDDEISMLEWLKDCKVYEGAAHKKMKEAVLKAREDQDYDKLDAINLMLRQDVTKKWREIEDELAPVVRKYR